MALSPQDMMAMFQQMNGGQQQQQMPDLAGLIQALRAPKPPSHLGMGGAQITPENPSGSLGGDPFSNGFFKTDNERIANESAHFGGGQFGATGVQAGLAPKQVNPLMFTQFPIGHVLPEAPFADQSFPLARMIPGGIESMINPGLPPEQKYQDSNFWSAIGKRPLQFAR